MSLNVGWSWWWQRNNQKDEFNPTLLSLSVFAITAIFLYLWTSNKSKQRSPPLPPGPRGLPLVGYLPFLNSDLHRTFNKLASVYGPIMKLQLGTRLCVVLSSPALAKEVLRDHDTVFANRDPNVAALALSYGANDMVWNSYGEDWRKLRKVCVREMLSNSNLDASYALRRREVRKMVRDVYNKRGEDVEINKLMYLTSFNVVRSMIWGGTVEVVGVEFMEVIGEMIELLGKTNISDVFPVLARFDIQGIERRQKELLARLDRIFESVIHQREKENMAAEGKVMKDFLQIVLDVNRQEEAKKQITRTQLKALFLDLISGGTDTTSTTIEWMMGEMMKQPRILRRAQQELEEVVGMENIVEESHIPKLHYLEAIVKETLRLHPVAPLLIPRRPSVSCTVGGYTVPKGTQIMLNVWAMQRDPQIWDSPSEFQPERFLREDTARCDYSGNAFHYLPFGSGRRMCPGITLAERMMGSAMASLLHSFNWRLPEGTELDFSEKFDIILKKSKRLIAIPTPRLSNLELYA